jgi:hypothetical protein
MPLGTLIFHLMQSMIEILLQEDDHQQYCPSLWLTGTFNIWPYGGINSNPFTNETALLFWGVNRGRIPKGCPDVETNSSGLADEQKLW